MVQFIAGVLEQLTDAFTRVDELALGGACRSVAAVPVERRLWGVQRSSILSGRLAA